MNSLIFMLMLQVPGTTQFLVSTKAGLVNYVQGQATVKPATTVPVGQIIQTGQAGAVELLLNPGSYLRMGENSKVVLEKVELYDIAVRIIEGSTVIEAYGFNKDLPLQVASGELKMEIVKDGVYLFADGKIVVVDGKIRDAGNGLIYTKGYEISNDQGYRARKVKTFTTGLELWSQKRDEEISRANLNVARSLRQTQNLPLSSFLDVWLWYPAFGSFIYMPGRGYRSPYGYRYITAGEDYSGGGGGNSGGSGGGGYSASRGGDSGGSGGSGSSSNASTGGNGNASFSGGGVSPGGPAVAGPGAVGPSPGAQGPHQGAPRMSVAP